MSIFDDVAGNSIFEQVANESSGNIFSQVAQETAAPLTREQQGEARLGHLAVAPSIPLPAFLEDFLVRAGRRFSEGTEAFRDLPQNLAGTVTGGDQGRLQHGIKSLQGAMYPMAAGLVPFEAASEQAATTIFPEPVAEQIGNFSTLPLAIASGRMDQAGKLGTAGQDLTRYLLGVGKAQQQPHPMNPGAFDVSQTPAAHVQPGLFTEADLAKTVDPRLAKIAALDVENKQIAEQVAQIAQWKKLKPGTEPELNIIKEVKETPKSALEVPDPLFPTTGMPQLDERQLKKVAFLNRHNPEQSVAYMQNIIKQHQIQLPMRSVEVGARVLGIPAERGRLARAFDALTSDPTLPNKPTDIGLFLRKMGQESSRMVESFGPYGQGLVNMVRTTYNRFESELSRTLDGDQGVLHMAKTFKLTKGERENITDVMEGIAAPQNTRVAGVAQEMMKQRAEIADRSKILELRDPRDGTIIPWIPRENYMPHFVDFDKVAKDPARLGKIIQEIQLQESVRLKRPVSVPEAQEIFNSMRSNSRQEYGHLEIARTFEFSDYDRDGIATWSRYMEGSLKRLSEAEVFQPKSENVVSAIQGIRMTAGEDAAQAAQRYIAQVMGHDPVTGIKSTDMNAGALFNFARSMQVGLKLGQAVIANASQSNMTGLITGYKNLGLGLWELRKAHGQEFGRLAGATIEQTMRDMNEAMGVGKFGGSVLKYTGFNRVEQFNRMLAANSGRVFANDLVTKLANGASGRAADTYKRHLRAMNIEPSEVISRGFKLTLDEELRAGRSVIARSQFKVRPQELPLYWNGPLGKLVTQFSSFGFKAAKALNDEVIKEAKQGNFAPLVRFALVTPFVGEIFADIQTLAKGKSLSDRPDNLIARIAENYASIGAFGLFYDALRASQYGEIGIARRLLGPTLSDTVSAAAGVAELAQGNSKPLVKMGLQNVPVVGSPLRRAVFPPKERQ